MQYLTTKKAIMNGFSVVISVPFCALQHLLACEKPSACIAGRDSWSADVYDFGSFAIVTGANPCGHIAPSYEVNRQYDDRAREILQSHATQWEAKPKLRGLISRYLTEVSKEGAES